MTIFYHIGVQVALCFSELILFKRYIWIQYYSFLLRTEGRIGYCFLLFVCDGFSCGLAVVYSFFCTSDQLSDFISRNVDFAITSPSHFVRHFNGTGEYVFVRLLQGRMLEPPVPLHQFSFLQVMLEFTGAMIQETGIDIRSLEDSVLSL